jgi:hypothetical protein
MTNGQAAFSSFPVIPTERVAGGPARASKADKGQVTACAPEAASAPSDTPARWQGALDSAVIRCRAKAARSRAQQLHEQARGLWAQTQALAQATENSARARLRGQPLRVRQNLLQRSEYARLLARLETMPVIEQAKGVLMAQSRCGDAEAFDLLRRASQRSNVPVRELAAQIVAQPRGPRPSLPSKPGPMPSPDPGLAARHPARRSESPAH